jgi:hypothetical protein
MNLEILENNFKSQFPNGYFRANHDTGLSGKQIVIDLGLIGNSDDVPNKIRHNDPMHHRFLIYINGDVLECKDIISGLALYPDTGSFMAMKQQKTGYRKTTGNHAKVEKSLNQFFIKLKKLVDDNKNNIYNSTQLKQYLV